MRDISLSLITQLALVAMQDVPVVLVLILLIATLALLMIKKDSLAPLPAYAPSTTLN
jgi:hypothetical protein